LASAYPRTRGDVSSGHASRYREPAPRSGWSGRLLARDRHAPAREWPDPTGPRAAPGSQASGLVRRDAPTAPKPWEASERHGDIAAPFVGDQSTGFQREASPSRSANARERRGGVLAITPLSSGRPRHRNGRPRPTSRGRRAGVSRAELSENRLALGYTRPQQGRRAHDPLACRCRSQSGTSHGLNNPTAAATTACRRDGVSRCRRVMV
jgi:hypothetical protein